MDAMHVLVIDDEQGIRDGCERILTRMGFKVFKANRGEAGLDIIRKEVVSIVLLDLKMPGMDGLEVLERIRAIDNSILVIIITGFATIETAIRAMKQGAYDFMPKPFEPDHLRIIVGRARENLLLTWEAEMLEAQRRKTLLDLGTEQSRIRTIIESLPNGLVVTNTRGQVVLMNPTFLRLLGLDPCRASGDRIEAYIDDGGFSSLVQDISQGKYSGTDETPTYELALPDNTYLMARGRPVLGEDGECLGAVFTLVNITTMKVLDQVKSEFVAKVSHELRSPLSTIHEQLALVLGEMVVEAESERGHYLLSRAKEKTRGLISLIGDLLDLSRIESGAVTREPVMVSLDEMLRSIVDFMQARVQAKKISMTAELPDEPLPEIKADPAALESIFGNLIANAINYTQEGGEIRVRAALEGDRLHVDVSDNGFGIEEKYLDKIFERFFRVKNEKTRFITGTGLGLPLVKGLVDALKGTISVKSQPGKGTTFTVFLPLETDKPECAGNLQDLLSA
ncbi:hybrid sensor histidine kinase/response regulato r [Desulfonema ishimotonii]|uniref:histidine kinase n=1 Tax=Desulfonema ishimotonii TaxID=45657 RepID=A0A401G471_9BACT|nr:ATP-binding protein [Desulfonema ishimotonii]GBC64038.1 hybrid sensor histidine kinase/response regulato r [Desulfonema ishimotonii]